MSAPRRPEDQPHSEVSACPGCERGFILLTRKWNCLGCGKIYCKRCLNNWIYYPKEYEYDEPQRCCASCFKELSSLDHSVSFQRFGSEFEKTIILLPPATLTRNFWLWHAEILAKQYRVYILDLPGHGSRMDEKLSIASCHDAIKNLMEDQNIVPEQCVLWGHHFGGYVALSFAGLNPDICLAVIGTECGCAYDERANVMWMAKESLLLSVTKNSDLAKRPLQDLRMTRMEPEMIMEQFLRPGTFYTCWDGILETISIKNYLALIRNYAGRTLFLNGSDCPRGAEERFVGAAQDSTLEIIEKAQNWFVVDERFRQEALEIVDEFLQSLHWKDPSPAKQEESEESKEEAKEEAKEVKEEEAKEVKEEEAKEVKEEEAKEVEVKEIKEEEAKEAKEEAEEVKEEEAKEVEEEKEEEAVGEEAVEEVKKEEAKGAAETEEVVEATEEVPEGYESESEEKEGEEVEEGEEEEEEEEEGEKGPEASE